MPTIQTLTIPAADVQKGDYITGLGGPVMSKRPLAVNVEFTLEGIEKTPRIPATREVTVTRSVPTIAEKREKLVDTLDEYTRRVIDTLNRTIDTGDAAIREKFNSSTDLLYTFQWETEGWMTQLQTLRTMHELKRWIEGNAAAPPEEAKPLHDLIIEFTTYVKERMLDWRPGRSTSAMSNLQDDAQFMAWKDLVNGLGRYDWAGVAYYKNALDEFDRVNGNLPKEEVTQ